MKIGMVDVTYLSHVCFRFRSPEGRVLLTDPFFAPAFTNRKSLASLFASHPPLEKRLEQLAKISSQLGSN